MSSIKPRARLRQAVLVAGELEPLVALLEDQLGLRPPFRDPGVGEFGLENAVFAIGDCFLEIVSPLRPGTAAGRQLERAGGDGGYMVLFDVEDLEAARRRAEERSVRTVWRIDLPDISGTHMHPADLRGAIVSLDRSQPYGTWRWGGPEWTGRVGSGAPGRLQGITVGVADPAEAASRWSHVLGVPVSTHDGLLIELDDGWVVFREAPAAVESIEEIAVALPPEVRAGRAAVEVGSALIVLSDMPA